VIGDNAYIGANSVVIGGINIGRNVFIGALSLVNKDIPDNAIAFGVPAKVIRYRTEEELAIFKQWSDKQR
jgi:galactoside O-acetyltransferase/maltose O-acetyltransferase